MSYQIKNIKDSTESIIYPITSSDAVLVGSLKLTNILDLKLDANLDGTSPGDILLINQSGDPEWSSSLDVSSLVLDSIFLKHEPRIGNESKLS